MKIPFIDLGKCTGCEACIAVCPKIFRKNEVVGYVEVIDRAVYPEEGVNEAIKNCPADCIFWEEI